MASDPDPMAKPLQGKTALVTGGGIGIGREIALALASAGARVAVTYHRHAPDDGFRTAVAAASGRDAICVELDATDAAEVQRALTTVGDSAGELSILVNNVGGLVRRNSIRDMDYELWKDVVALNLDSMFLVTHHVLRHFDFPDGRIINVASLAGRNGGHAGATAYAATKAAVFGFTRGLAKELAPSGTTVNALAPGFIEGTPFHDTFTSDESKAATIASIPVGRAGTPSDVASAAVWLASPGAGFVSGTVIDINGAQYFG
ncbi:MAG TPA: SDR family oxidoreductase [Galbitalea sp.]|nr:SDR family oxidoreductase [Galbitalea sp.]